MNLFGWDTAYATHFQTLNAALKGATDMPQAFSVSGSGLSASGRFGDWQVQPGSSGTLLHIASTLVSGKITGGNDPDGDLAGVIVTFEVDLTLLPTGVAGQKALRLNLQKAGKRASAADSGVVQPYDLGPPGLSLGIAQQAFLPGALAQFLVDNAAAFSFAFARANLVAPGAGGWLEPVSLAYSSYENGTDSYLVLYGATDGRDVSALPRSVDPALLSGPGPAYFAVSGGLFLNNVVRPVMPDVFAGTSKADYGFDAATPAVTSGASIHLPGVKSGAIWYYPILDHVRVTLDGAHVVIAVSGSADLYMGMSMTFSVTSRCPASFDPAKDVIAIARDPSPSSSHDSHIPWYDYLLGLIPDVIMAIVVPIIAGDVADTLGKELSGIAFAKAGPQSVAWPGITGFAPNAGGLNGAFQMSGG